MVTRPARATTLRHEVPEIDDAALVAARLADAALAAAREGGSERWARFLAPLPDGLRDEPLPGLRAVALRARSAYGAKDSIRDVLPEEVTEPLVAALDRLIRALNRHDATPR